jgi:hypothetical protein
MMNESQVKKFRSVPGLDADADIPSEGDPLPGTSPVALPCHGPDCDEIVVTHLTDADKEASPTVEIGRIHPMTGNPRHSTFWFCSDDCRTAFIQSSERVVALTEEERR